MKEALGVVRIEVVDLSARLDLTMRTTRNQTTTGGVVQFNKIKVLEPKILCGVRDAKALENFIFELEQYF